MPDQNLRKPWARLPTMADVDLAVARGDHAAVEAIARRLVTRLERHRESQKEYQRGRRASGET